MTCFLSIAFFACFSFNFLKLIEAQPPPPPPPLNALTWNMQGACSASDSRWVANIEQMMLPAQGNEVLALQETGNRPDSAELLMDGPGQTIVNGYLGRNLLEYLWSYGTDRTDAQVYIYHFSTQPSRVSLAIVSRRRADETFVFYPRGRATRPVIGIRIGSSYYFNMHADPNESEAHLQVTEIENYMSERLEDDPNANWIIMGDYNRNPEDLRPLLDPPPPGVERLIVNSGQSTQLSGGELDYAVSGRAAVVGAAIALRAAIRIPLQFMSDHLPVYIRRRCGN